MYNFLEEEILLPITFALFFIGVSVYNYLRNSTNTKVIDVLLHEYFADQNLTILSISKIKTADKIKYGIPFNPLFSLYTTTFNYFLPSKENYYREVETIDENQNECLRYLEISFSSANGINVKEFDSYNF